MGNSINCDVKAPVGAIPPSEPLRPLVEGKSYFKAELLAGPDQGLVLPFHQDHVCRKLSIDYYVAIQGLSFAIRIKLARPLV
jgi:hypothetical protein